MTISNNRIITLNTTWPINCQATFTLTQLFGNITIGTASLNLAFRVSTSDIECSKVVLTLAIADSRHLAKQSSD